ncbi:MAG: pilus assembly protein TadG-related protein [Pirellulales bacterium]
MSHQIKTKHVPLVQRVKQKGTIATLTAFLLVPLLGMVAFTVDYGYLLDKRADLQRAADAAALAAVRDLVPTSDGTQDLDAVKARVREYAQANLTEITNLSVLDADIDIGRYDPETIYSDVTLLNTGVLDTVRVTLRRDSTANSPVSLFFARVLGVNSSDVSVTATAVLQKASIIGPGVGVLPFGVPIAEWDTADQGDIWSIYGDGRLLDDTGGSIPGNWGTVDLGSTNNSTSDIRDQIVEGLRQEDIDALYDDDRISSSEFIDSQVPLYVNGDPGLSSGIKLAVQAIYGESRLVPLYDSVAGNGGNVEFHIVGWGVAKVIDSSWNGANDTWVKIEKSYTYDTYLRAQSNLSNETGVIEGAYASPALVQ